MSHTASYLVASISTLIMIAGCSSPAISEELDGFVTIPGGTYEIGCDKDGANCTRIDLEEFNVATDFISLEKWNNCVTAGVCIPGSSLKAYPQIGTPVGITMRNFFQISNYLNINGLRLLTYSEFEVAFLLNALPEKVKSIKTWLSECEEDETFIRPSNEWLRSFGLPDDWPFRADVSTGRICESNTCVSCATAWIEGSQVNTQKQLSERSLPDLGVLFAR